jgi:hypothetical protein
MEKDRISEHMKLCLRWIGMGGKAEYKEDIF